MKKKELIEDNIRLKKAIIAFLDDLEAGGYNSNSRIGELKKVVRYNYNSI